MMLSLVWGAAAVVFISPAYLGVALMSLVIVVGVQLVVYMRLRARVSGSVFVGRCMSVNVHHVRVNVRSRMDFVYRSEVYR